MPFAISNQAKIHWTGEMKEGRPPLLLLNSLGTDNGMWDLVMPDLAETHSVIRMDTRGHGASEVTSGDYTVDQLAEDALAVLDEAGAEKTAVCGLSLGGMMALRLGLLAPDRVSRIVVCNSSAKVPSEPWIERAELVRREGMSAIADAVIERFFSEGYRGRSGAGIEPLRATVLSTAPEGYAACCMAISKVDMLDEIASIKHPVLVVNGSLDVATPAAEHGDLIAARIENAKSATLEAGHISAIEQPDEFARTVSGFLSEDEAA